MARRLVIGSVPLLAVALMAFGAERVYGQGQPAPKCEDTLAVMQELLASTRNRAEVYEAQLAQASAALKQAREQAAKSAPPPAPPAEKK